MLRRTMLIAVAAVGICTIAGSFPYATLSPSLAASEVPGYAVARAYEGDGFAAVIALGDWAAAAVATVLMGFGLWVVVSQQPYT